MPFSIPPPGPRRVGGLPAGRRRALTLRKTARYTPRILRERWRGRPSRREDVSVEGRQPGMMRARIVTGLTVGLWTLGAGAGYAAEAKTAARAVSGEVVATEGKSNTLVVKGKA